MDKAGCTHTAGPTLHFKSTKELVTEVGDGRTVALHLGADRDGIQCWAVRMVNDGHETLFAMSEEALDALLGMYVAFVREEGLASPSPVAGGGE